MNFFEAQDAARRSTSVLVLLFVLAVALLLVLSNILFFEFIYFLHNSRLSFSLAQLETVFDTQLSIMLSAAVLLFIILGSLFKLLQLSAGGSVVAEQLGGVIVPRSTTDPLQRKILNVVEEMAIASGTPVPQVYVLNESGINAFAAGWKTTNAVIGITRGALEQLSRDELQGVIAHEFSHIFNGDMRLNIRLIAVLHGILMIGMLGRMILRSLRHVGRSRGRRTDGRALLVIFGVGASLMIVGYSGTFFGGWIKAMISRQREYLADASAVQFTRSSDGIANALKKIGGSGRGSYLLTARAEAYSHAYFSEGLKSLALFSFATHPPLKLRIRRLQPRWDGKYIYEKTRVQADSSKAPDESPQQRRQRVMAAATAMGAGVAVYEAMNAVESIGEVSQEQVDAAQLWRREMPDEILEQAENPYGAQAIVLALLLHEDESLQQQQYRVLDEVIGELHTQSVRSLQPQLVQLDRAQTLPLIDLALPTLREMTVPQYQRFKQCMQKLIAADKKMDLREWIIQRLITQHLDDNYKLRKKPVAKYFVLGSAKKSSELMLSMLAYIEHRDKEQAQIAFDRAKRSISAGALQMLDKNEISLSSLNAAMDDLEFLKPPLKKRFLQACVTCIAYDGKVGIRAYELTRAIASCLDCPMPPVLVNPVS